MGSVDEKLSGAVNCPGWPFMRVLRIGMPTCLALTRSSARRQLEELLEQTSFLVAICAHAITIARAVAVKKADIICGSAWAARR